MQYLHVRTLQTISDVDLLLTVENLENGYYVPEDLPALSAQDLSDLGNLSFTRRLAKLLACFFPSFSMEELRSCVDKHYAKLNSKTQSRPLNDFMPLYLAQLDQLSSGSIYDYILPLLLDLQLLAESKQGLTQETPIYLEHNLGNSSFAALVQALSTRKTKAALYYNPKRINNVVHKRIFEAYQEQVDLHPVDNALSLPTLSLFAGRFRKIKAQVEQGAKHLNAAADSVSAEKELPLKEQAAAKTESLSAYPAATRSSLDSLAAVLIATALQLALLADLPLKNKQEADTEKKRSRKPVGDYRRINLFLPAKQGYLLLAACYAKVICPLINCINLAGMRGNFLCELVRNGKFELKSKQNTFELPVQLERMLFEFVSRNNEKSLELLNDFALKGTLQLNLAAKHNINGLITAELFSDKQEERLLLSVYDRFDLLLAPLSVLAVAAYLKHYDQQKQPHDLALVFINASIYRYALKVTKAIFTPEQLKGFNFLQTMQLLALESGETFPQWFQFEQNIPAEAAVADDRFDPEKHRDEFEKIRFEGLSKEDIAALF